MTAKPLGVSRCDNKLIDLALTWLLVVVVLLLITSEHCFLLYPMYVIYCTNTLGGHQPCPEIECEEEELNKGIAFGDASQQRAGFHYSTMSANVRCAFICCPTQEKFTFHPIHDL